MRCVRVGKSEFEERLKRKGNRYEGAGVCGRGACVFVWASVGGLLERQEREKGKKETGINTYVQPGDVDAGHGAHVQDHVAHGLAEMAGRGK